MVYGMNKHEVRKPLWEYLRRIRSNIDQCPWLILGDLNATRHIEERLGSSEFDALAMDDFNQCIEDIDVAEFSSGDRYYTRSNHRDDGIIFSKIDRIFANASWFCWFSWSCSGVATT